MPYLMQQLAQITKSGMGICVPPKKVGDVGTGLALVGDEEVG